MTEDRRAHDDGGGTGSAPERWADADRADNGSGGGPGGERAADAGAPDARGPFTAGPPPLSVLHVLRGDDPVPALPVARVEVVRLPEGTAAWSPRTPLPLARAIRRAEERSRRRDDRDGRPVSVWPGPGARPVIHARGERALAACWVAAAWTGTSAAVVATRGVLRPRESPPGSPVRRPWLWQRADLVLLAGGEERRRLLAAGLERRRVRAVEDPERPRELGKVYRALAEGPAAR